MEVQRFANGAINVFEYDAGVRGALLFRVCGNGALEVNVESWVEGGWGGDGEGVREGRGEENAWIRISRPTCVYLNGGF